VETGIRENGYIEVNCKSMDLLDRNVVVKSAYAVLGSMKHSSAED
jgi:hypothetical protein